MTTTALIERGKDGTFGIFTPEIDSTIIGEGRTVAEAKEDFENSVKEVIEAYNENGDELPEELKNIQFVFKYDIASMFDYYDWINVSRFAKKSGYKFFLNAPIQNRENIYFRTTNRKN